MTIYSVDSFIVDEAVIEYDNEGRNSEMNARAGWYYAIEQMVQAIKAKLEDIYQNNAI